MRGGKRTALASSSAGTPRRPTRKRLVAVRVSILEERAWLDAAAAAGQTVSGWLRHLGNQAARE